MTDTFKEIGSLFGGEGAGAGFAKQTDKESFTYAFAWPEGDTWATLTGYLNLDEQPEEYVRRVLQGTGSGSSGLTGSLCRTETNGSPPSRMRNVRTCRWDGFRLLCMESNP